MKNQAILIPALMALGVSVGVFVGGIRTEAPRTKPQTSLYDSCITMQAKGANKPFFLIDGRNYEATVQIKGKTYACTCWTNPQSKEAGFDTIPLQSGQTITVVLQSGKTAEVKFTETPK